jgi:RNA polymerase sigma factor (sigma-70 family)
MSFAPPSRFTRPPNNQSHGGSTADLQLAAEFAAGRVDAAAALYSRIKPVVTRTVHRLLGASDQEKEDVVHLVFIEVFKTIESFRGLGPLDAWVGVVSSRVVYEHIRHRQFRRKFVQFSALEAIRATSHVTGRHLAFRDALRRIERHLAKVDANRSFTFLLHDVYGYDIREVAHMTGVGVHAARTRLVRGRREIRKRAHSDPELASLADDLSQA